MRRCIKWLSESPCYKCGKDKACTARCKSNPALWDIVDMMFGNAEADYNWCPIYIALTAPDMTEVEDG